MIWHKNAKPWTKEEQSRADRMAEEIGCIFCWLNDGHPGPCDHRHHIKDGNKRMGHWYTLPLCTTHHDDCHNGTFGHAVQIDRWLKVQHALGLDDTLPPTKIIPRRIRAERNQGLVDIHEDHLDATTVFAGVAPEDHPVCIRAGGKGVSK